VELLTKNDSLCGKRLTLGTKLIPHWLATDGFEISAKEIPKSGPRSHKSMHETVKIIAIMQHSSKCMPNVKMAWLHQEML
jgi:hypothetical protein